MFDSGIINISCYLDKITIKLSNIEEYKYGTNPKDNDTDDDNLLDGEEINIYNTDPTNPDADGDGYNDGLEVERGTDPNDPSDFPENDKPSSGSDRILGYSLCIFIPSIVGISIFFLKKRARDF